MPEPTPGATRPATASQAAAVRPALPQPVGEYAFHGPAGDIIEKVLPYSEADPHALLLNLLALFGNRVGRNARHHIPGGKPIYPNEYVGIVGVTGDARKSTAMDAVMSVWALVEPEFEGSLNFCLGLGSGEGLIYRIRDASVDSDGRMDPGVADKRLMVHVDEFGALFTAIGREGSLLGDVLKIAFGGGSLQSAVKGHAQRATNPHISLVACTTEDQLCEALSGRKLRGRLADGFANRFLWCLVERSKRLSRLTQPEELGAASARAEAAALLRIALDWVLENGPVLQWDERGGQDWDEWYHALAVPSRFAGVLARAESHVLRLTMLYALLDRSPVMQAEHLKAALEVERYCTESAILIFDPILDAKPGGSSSSSLVRSEGRRAEDKLLDYLHQHHQATRKTTTCVVFHRNMARSQIDAILNNLLTQGSIRLTRDHSTHPSTEIITLNHTPSTPQQKRTTNYEQGQLWIPAPPHRQLPRSTTIGPTLPSIHLDPSTYPKKPVSCRRLPSGGPQYIHPGYSRLESIPFFLYLTEYRKTIDSWICREPAFISTGYARAPRPGHHNAVRDFCIHVPCQPPDPPRRHGWKRHGMLQHDGIWQLRLLRRRYSLPWSTWAHVIYRSILGRFLLHQPWRPARQAPRRLGAGRRQPVWPKTKSVLPLTPVRPAQRGLLR